MVKRILFCAIASIMVGSYVQASVASKLDEQAVASEVVCFFEQHGYSEESLQKMLQQKPAVAESLSSGSLESFASVDIVFLSIVVFFVGVLFLRGQGCFSDEQTTSRYKSHVEL